MKIYTRTGDEGLTSLFSGKRVSKNDLRVEVYGTVDEMNSALGVARASDPNVAVDAALERVQNVCFVLGADLATPLEGGQKIVRMDASETAWLEQEMDRMSDVLPPLQNFILPGGSPAAAQIHVARSICRRAERQAVSLAAQEEINREVIIYLNRLSDFLFTLARFENLSQVINETKWTATPGGKAV